MRHLKNSCIGAMALWLTLAGLASPAHAWANGSDGPNSFGGHDWILKKALKAAGSDADWVKQGVALRATDDPDTKDGIDHASGTWWHVYDEWGSTWGGAPEAAEVLFERLQRRLANEKFRKASKTLGHLAHIVGDVANPTHTDSSKREDRMHSSHESAVDSRIDGYSFRYDGRTNSDPFKRTLKVARMAHDSYWRLVNNYVRHGYNGVVDRVTQRQLKRGANAVADLITSLRS